MMGRRMGMGEYRICHKMGTLYRTFTKDIMDNGGDRIHITLKCRCCFGGRW